MTDQWQLPAQQRYRIVANEWIPISDGTQLAVRLWLPESTEHERVPVVLEYIPYRKDDGSRELDSATGHYLAEHGIAFARVDIRGSGDSRGGLLRGEYLPEEQADGVAAIAWLASRPWCNGAVGMRGYSWGAFSSLQIAALAPPQLKAIMPMCPTDNRFASDMHYVGGSLSLANFEWGSALLTVMTGPPDPQQFGPAWKSEWLHRLEGLRLPLADWLSHQRFDAFWQQGSIGLDWSRIRCPVYFVGGWEDSYNEPIDRGLRQLSVPRKALIGPWGHCYPNKGWPGPALDWAHEEVRWWTQWLKGIDTGIMSEPLLRFYMPWHKASEMFPADTLGYWAAEASWPSPKIQSTEYFLASHGLSPTPALPERVEYKADRIVGLQRMAWLPVSRQVGGTGLAEEQTADDEASLVFDSPPLEADLEILGQPTLRVQIAASTRIAKVAVRLNEVAPDGRSWQVTYGLLNLTHRMSHEHPTPLAPGNLYDIELRLKLMAHRFKKGSRIRVALSEGLWPLVWPSPEPVTLTVVTGTSSLVLPARPAGPEPPFQIPSLPTATELLQAPCEVCVTGPDESGRVRVQRSWPEGAIGLLETNTKMGGGWRDWTMEVAASDPNTCVWRGHYWILWERADWGRNIVASSFELHSTPTTFRLQASVNACHDDVEIFQRQWDQTFPRELL